MSKQVRLHPPGSLMPYFRTNASSISRITGGAFVPDFTTSTHMPGTTFPVAFLASTCHKCVTIMNFVYWLIFGDKGKIGVCRIGAEVKGERRN